MSLSSMNSESEKPIIVLGAGGHATVLIQLLLSLGKNVIGFVAPIFCEIKNCPNITYLGDDPVISEYTPSDILLVNGVGGISVEKNKLRHAIYSRFKNQGYSFYTLVHPQAMVADTVKLGEGTQVMAGAVVQPNTHIGKNVIINTRSSVDHDCIIGDGVHVAPGVTLGGDIRVGDLTHIGIGSVLIQGIYIGKEVMICAGEKVFHSIENYTKIKKE
jgi:sugar O-acyltransferase (sialic acid O-acetyltransferase NeuD family)